MASWAVWWRGGPLALPARIAAGPVAWEWFTEGVLEEFASGGSEASASAPLGGNLKEECMVLIYSEA